MRTTLHWSKDSTTGDIHFSGVISAWDFVYLRLSPVEAQRLSAPVLTAADFMEIASIIFRAGTPQCSPEGSPNASK